MTFLSFFIMIGTYQVMLKLYRTMMFGISYWLTQVSNIMLDTFTQINIIG